MPTIYEWVVEQIDEHDDIFDTSAWDTAAGALNFAKHVQARSHPHRIDIALTRNVYDSRDTDDLIERQYAYLNDHTLPPQFDASDVKVPQRYQEELASAQSLLQQVKQ